MGKTRANRSGSSIQPPAICGVSDDVAHVSITSGSPTKPPGWPRWSAVKPGGTSDDGSMGSVDSSGTIGWSWSISPSTPSRYQTGKGTPKKRCREISQSPLRPPTQFSYRWRMNSGYQVSSRPRSRNRSRSSGSRPPLRMYHCRLVTISSGREPRS